LENWIPVFHEKDKIADFPVIDEIEKMDSHFHENDKKRSFHRNDKKRVFTGKTKRKCLHSNEIIESF